MTFSQNSLRVLSIQSPEEDLTDLKSVSDQLGMKIEIQQVKTKVEIDKMVKNQSWGMILSEFNLDGFTVVEALNLVRRNIADVPFIIISDRLGEENVADVMRAGVEDIILRSHPARLDSVLKRLFNDHDSQTKEKNSNKSTCEAFAIKEQMLAIVSHDIKNPLSAINLEAQMLLRVADRAPKSIFSEEVKIQANRILKTTDRMKNLISDLLDRSKTESGLQRLEKSEVNLNQIIQEAVDSLRPIALEKGITFETSLKESSQLNGDRNKLFQVFTNLLSNAVKFSPPGLVVRVNERETDQDFIFSIEDFGPGLHSSELKKVFDKFWTGGKGKANGTGLGLFITKTIVEAHGGSIVVENLPRGGASFCFSLPKEPDASQLTFERIIVPRDQRKIIFVVDDDDDLREVIAWVMEKEGFEVRSFSSPKDVLYMLTQTHLNPDLLIVDFHLDEINGCELVKRIRKLTGLNELPAVLITASPLDVETTEERDLTGEIITKPVNLEGLVMTAEKMIAINAP